MNREQRKNKCIYCEDNKEATHFICEDCGCGMCEDCYDYNKEHDEHCFDFHESIEEDDFYSYVSDTIKSPYGFMCYNCMEQRYREFEKIKANRKMNIKEYQKAIDEDLFTTIKDNISVALNSGFWSWETNNTISIDGTNIILEVREE